jgi:hypothetical protein
MEEEEEEQEQAQEQEQERRCLDIFCFWTEGILIKSLHW